MLVGFRSLTTLWLLSKLCSILVEQLWLRAGTARCGVKLPSACSGSACGMPRYSAENKLRSDLLWHSCAAQQAQWEFMDAMLTAESDMFCDVSKLRRAGFNSQVCPSMSLEGQCA